MKNSSLYNCLNDYVIDRKQLLGKGATGEVYAGNPSLIQLKVSLIRLQWQSKLSI
jgi:hypothetical protein